MMPVSSASAVEVAAGSIATTTLINDGAVSARADRVDALVWALTNLLLDPMSNQGIFDLYRQLAENRRS